MNRITIVIADDHHILLDGLRALLVAQEDIYIAGMYDNGLALYEDLDNTMPDIALVDINMPGLNGHELTLKIKKEKPSVRVIALSMYDAATDIIRLIDAGVSAYLFKNVNNDLLLEAIRTVAKGKTYFSPEIADIITTFVEAERNKEKAPAPPRLTARELEILKLISREQSNAQIASALFISERTVETHRKNMLRKTNHKSMVGLLKDVMEQHLI
jgi:DNA-binding NarL/FixJ family response regulator